MKCHLIKQGAFLNVSGNPMKHFAIVFQLKSGSLSRFEAVKGSDADTTKSLVFHAKPYKWEKKDGVWKTYSGFAAALTPIAQMPGPAAVTATANLNWFAVQEAIRHHVEGLDEYNLVRNNCQHLAEWVFATFFDTDISDHVQVA